MTSYDNQYAKSQRGCIDSWHAERSWGDINVETRYMYIPGYGVMMTAAPGGRWNAEKSRIGAESHECGKEMIRILFQQLTSEYQREIIAMCEELAAENDSRKRRY